MKVYHGSYTEITVIDLSKCELGRDFGKGFYVTKLREQAEFWAKRKGRINNTDQTLIKKNNLTEKDAIDLYFSSNTYKQLTDETANLVGKSWEEIYELLKQELKI